MALNALGISTIEDPDAHQRLQGFLDRSEGLDMILWLAAGEDSKLRCQILVQDPAALAANRVSLRRP